jgi:hypothetical protein
MAFMREIGGVLRTAAKSTDAAIVSETATTRKPARRIA